MSNKLVKGLVATAVLAALTGCGSDNNKESDEVVRKGNPLQLNIIHMNDTHSNFDPVKSKFTLGAEGSEYYTSFGGYPRLLEETNYLIAQKQEQGIPSLVLHGGDAWQGTVYFSLNDGAANAQLLKQMKIDAMAFGNHEFDLDTDKLKSFVDEVNFPMLAANMDTSTDSALAGNDNIKPYQLFAFKGDTKRAIDSAEMAEAEESILAVIGVVLEDMPEIAEGTGDILFQKEIETTQRTIDELIAQGVNKIAVLSHIGLKRDILLAEGTSGLDLIIGGHSHTLMGDFTDLSLGNNPEYAQRVGASDTCIVQAGELAQALGNLSVQFDADGKLAECGGVAALLSDDTFFEKERRQDEDKVSGLANDVIKLFINNNNNIKMQKEDEELRKTIDSDYKPEYDKAFGNELTVVDETIVPWREGLVIVVLTSMVLM